MGGKPTKYCVNMSCKYYDPYITLVCDECSLYENAMRDADSRVEKLDRCLKLCEESGNEELQKTIRYSIAEAKPRW